MGEPAWGWGAASWDTSSEALADVDAARAALGVVQDALRSAVPHAWVGVAADAFTARLMELLGGSHRLEGLVDDARTAAVVVAREVALDQAGDAG